MQKNTKILITAAVVLVVIVGITYFFSNRNKGEKEGQEPKQEEGTVLPAHISSISAKHSVANGVHTIAGEVPLPTPCDTLDAKAVVAESFPEQVKIAFTSTRSSAICTQVVDSRRFKVTFSASEKATISATWNGEPITLNLTASTQRELDLFNIYIKG